MEKDVAEPSYSNPPSLSSDVSSSSSPVHAHHPRNIAREDGTRSCFLYHAYDIAPQFSLDVLAWDSDLDMTFSNSNSR